MLGRSIGQYKNWDHTKQHRATSTIKRIGKSGTKEIQKTTQRITNAKEIDSAEIVGEGTTRDAHQFRTSTDLLKTLPTGVGAVLIAHGQETPHGASSVFKIRFPELRKV